MIPSQLPWDDDLRAMQNDVRLHHMAYPRTRNQHLLIVLGSRQFERRSRLVQPLHSGVTCFTSLVPLECMGEQDCRRRNKA